jgi:hypothetical protein
VSVNPNAQRPRREDRGFICTPYYRGSHFKARTENAPQIET